MDYSRARQPRSQQPRTAPAPVHQPPQPRIQPPQMPHTPHPRRQTMLPARMGEPAPQTVPLIPPQTVVVNTGAPVPAQPPYPPLYESPLPLDYTTPILLEAVATDLSLAELDPEYARSPQEIRALLKSWLRRPCFDPEYAHGVEAYAGEIAAWHDAQLARKAQILGCSLRMINILEELVRCFVDERPPGGILARRVLLEY